MGNSLEHNAAASPHSLNWQNNTIMRQLDVAKEMDSNHLHDDTTLHTTNDTRHSIRRHVTQNSSNNPKAEKHATKTGNHVLSPTPHSNKMLYVPLHFDKYENHALLDTCAAQSAMSEAELRKITTTHPEAILQELQPPSEFQNPNSKRELSPRT